MLEIFTLGGVCFRLNGQFVDDIGLRKAEALLVYLAVTDRPIQRSVLADLFWPQHAHTKVLTSLRAALAALHRKFPEELAITRESVQINPHRPCYLDLKDLAGQLAAGQIESALNGYKGDFMAGFHAIDSAPFEEWMLTEQMRIRDALISALHESLSLAIGTRDIAFGLRLAHKLLDLDAYDEIGHQGCMLLHTLNGERAAAVRHYQDCVEILEADLGVSPQADTQTLFAMISRGETPNLGQGVDTRHNLPQSINSFVGRRVELFQIHQKLQDPSCRLMTLVGPGGSGKTRLAIEVGRLAGKAFPDGVYFVPLDAYHSQDLVVPAIAHALGLQFDTIATRLEPEHQLVDYLRRRAVLLILDGFEGLAVGAPLLVRMLENVPGLKILVTSRQSLNLQSEWPYFIDGLLYQGDEVDSLASTQVESVRLFLERAIQVKSTFAPSERDMQCITRICQLVEGMPLAIELAAAWVGVLSVEEIEQALLKNLDILSTDRFDVPEKHHSIRAVFESGWDLLPVEQQTLLCKLAIFGHSFDHQAAVVVAQGENIQLSSLVNRSLVRCDPQGRFSTHTLIRMFAYDKLAQMPVLLESVRERYCRHYLNLLIESEADMIGVNMEANRLTLWQDLFHFHQAAQWAIARWDTESLRRVFSATVVLYAAYGWFEGVAALRQLGHLMLEEATKRNDPDPEHHPVVLTCLAYLAFLLTNLGQIDESEMISQRCLAPLDALGLKAEYSVCLHNLGANACFRGEYEAGTDLVEQAVLIGRDSGFSLWPTYLLWLGHGYLLLGEYEAGLDSLQKCREIFLRMESLWGAGFAISKIGLAYDGMGDHQNALAYHQEALSVFERIGNIAGKGYSLSRMSMSACFAGNYQLAIRSGDEAYQLFEEIGHSWGLASTLPRLGFAHLGMAQVEEARRLFQQGMRLSQQIDMVPLTLFALSGIAMTMLKGENQAAAIDLLSYVVVHPKAPAAFLNLPLGMLDPADLSVLKKRMRMLEEKGFSEPVSEMIDRYQDE